ncbi:MAG: acyl carrier protein [Polyangia bacterium]
MTQHEQTVCDVLAHLFDQDLARMQPSTSLHDELGVDSTEMVDVVCALEKAFKIRLPDETERVAKTIADLGRIIGENLTRSVA